MRLRWLLIALLSTLVIAFFHLWALSDNLYWSYRWLDVPMHILGGFLLGAAMIGILKDKRPILYCAAIAFAAIAWEVFEFVARTDQPDPYVLDTTFDLVNAALGAGIAYALALHTTWRSN